MISALKSLNQSEQALVLVKTLQQAYKDSLFLTAKNLLGYNEITEYTHGEMIRCLQSASKQKLICVPRGCFKSSIGSVSYPIWLLVNNPNLRILLDSELYENSKNFLREIKAHLQSDNFINVFGDWRSRTWNEGEIIINTRTINKKEASITCGGVGTQKTSQHYEVIIADDLNSTSNSNTIENRMKIIDHFRRYTSLLEPDGTLVIIGTRYADTDVIGYILEEEGIDDHSI